MRAIVVAIAAIIALCVSQPQQIGCEKVWRYDLQCAVERAMNDSEIAKISKLAEKLRGKNCAETAWNVLEWVDKNVEYDYAKAAMPEPVIIVRGSEVTVQNPDKFYQMPSETIKLRRGICGDIALLTAALLKADGCEAYVLNITLKNGYHAAVAVKIGDDIYILDQHLPPLDPGSYLKKLKLDGKEVVSIEPIGNMTLKYKDYSMTPRDAKLLEEKIEDAIAEKAGAMNVEGLRAGGVELRLYRYAEYYAPPFADEYAEHIAEKLLRKMGRFARFDVTVKIDGGDLVVRMLAR